MAEPLVIECAGLSKHYGPVVALHSVDLRVPKGSIYGFLGRNGAGKTTTIKTLLGMVHPTSGWCASSTRRPTTPRPVWRSGNAPAS